VNAPDGFKQMLSVVTRLWDDEDYAAALAEVESMLTSWPGNAHLHVLRAGLVQLEEEPTHVLDDAKRALHLAVEFGPGSPAAAIELGHFLDHVEDDPRAAAEAYAAGVAVARRLLLDGLIGQAKAFRQLDKSAEFRRCLMEILHLTRFETGPKRTELEESGADVFFESPAGHFHVVQLTGSYAGRIQELLGGVNSDSPTR